MCTRLDLNQRPLCYQQSARPLSYMCSIFVQPTGLEPAYVHLERMATLPIRLRLHGFLTSTVCAGCEPAHTDSEPPSDIRVAYGWWESNPHVFRQSLLRRPCIPFQHIRVGCTVQICASPYIFPTVRNQVGNRNKVGETTALSSFAGFVKGSHRPRATSSRGLTTYTTTGQGNGW